MVRFDNEARCVHCPASTLSTNRAASREALRKGELLMFKTFVPAAMVLILAVTPVSAGPASSSLLQLKSVMPADTMQAQDLDGNRDRRGERHRGRDHNYTAGRRYDRAPSHYRRHAYRPRDWESRGCILVGPAWFCV